MRISSSFPSRAAQAARTPVIEGADPCAARVATHAVAGISQIEALIGLVLTALVLLVFMGLVSMEDFGVESGRGIMTKTKLIYAGQRVEELRSYIRIYLDRTGRLPGDFSGGSKNAPGGNDNGRIDARSPERDAVMVHLHDAKIIPTDTPMLLGYKVEYYWIDPPFLGHADGGHYFVVRDCPIWLAKYLDRQIDDGRSEAGTTGWTRRRGSQTDFYIRFDP